MPEKFFFDRRGELDPAYRWTLTAVYEAYLPRGVPPEGFLR